MKSFFFLIIFINAFLVGMSFANEKSMAHCHEDILKYLNSMDKPVLQKIAFAGLMPPTGIIVDMGSGSGKGTFELASLYPQAKVIGVDLDSEFIDRSKNMYVLENLSYKQGDITEKQFLEESVDGVFFSSVLHHVTSFNKQEPYALTGVQKALDNAVLILKNNGILIVRDFVIPSSPEFVYLDLPNNDGKKLDKTSDVKELSSSSFFEIFANDFRSYTHKDSGIPYKKSL